MNIIDRLRDAEERLEQNERSRKLIAKFATDLQNLSDEVRNTERPATIGTHLETARKLTPRPTPAGGSAPTPGVDQSQGPVGTPDETKVSQIVAELKLAQATAQTAFAHVRNKLTYADTGDAEQTQLRAPVMRELSAAFIQTLETRIPRFDETSLRNAVAAGNFESLIKPLSEEEFTRLRADLVQLFGTRLTLLGNAAEAAAKATQALKKEKKNASDDLETIRDIAREEGKLSSVVAGIGLPVMCIVIVAALVILFYIVGKAHTPDALRDLLRSNPLLDLSTVFLLTTTILLLGFSKRLTSEVLGTLIGGISGFVLGRSTRTAAAADEREEIKALVGGATPKPASSPASQSVKAVMQPVEKRTLPAGTHGFSDDQISLDALSEHMKAIGSDRLAFFEGNQPSGRGIAVLHQSTIEKFRSQQPPQDPSKKYMLAHLRADPTFAQLFDKSVGWVAETATLADAKRKMDEMSRTNGPVGNCYDVFVTATGDRQEPVVGWITNDALINATAQG